MAALLAAGVVVAAGRPLLETLAFAWWAACAVALAFVDVAVHRLPNRLTYPAAIGALGLLGVAAFVEHHGDVWLRAAAAGLVTALAFAVLTIALGQRGPGLGDAKLMLSTAAILGWISWAALIAGLLVGLTVQGLWAAALLVTRRATRSTRLPAGPFLIVGAGVALVLLGR